MGNQKRQLCVVLITGLAFSVYQRPSPESQKMHQCAEAAVSMLLRVSVVMEKRRRNRCTNTRNATRHLTVFRSNTILIGWACDRTVNLPPLRILEVRGGCTTIKQSMSEMIRSRLFPCCSMVSVKFVMQERTTATQQGINSDSPERIICCTIDHGRVMQEDASTCS